MGEASIEIFIFSLEPGPKKVNGMIHDFIGVERASLENQIVSMVPNRTSQGNPPTTPNILIYRIPKAFTELSKVALWMTWQGAYYPDPSHGFPP